MEGGEKTKEKGGKERQERRDFLITSPRDFGCGGEGKINNFVYRVCVAMLFHFVASFVPSLISSFFFSPLLMNKRDD